MENSEKPCPPMTEIFPIEQLRRMIMHIDRYDTEVVDNVSTAVNRLEASAEKLTDEIIEQNL